MKRILFIVAIMLIAGMAFSQENAPKKVNKENNQSENVEKRSDILFDKLVHDFGAIEKGGDASCVFTFKNVTKKPITLTNVKTSCGCTAADWPKEPIAKKKKGSIKVKYDSNRIGKFTKTIKVFIEGNENPIQLEIRGTIVAPNANDVKVAPADKKVNEIDNTKKSANPQVKEAKPEEVKQSKK